MSKTMGKQPGGDWPILLLCGLATWMLYFPVLNNGFLTDDYAALYRISVTKEVLHREFLRPLIDISFYFNYIFSGLQPRGYYVFNFLVHSLTAFMIYKVAVALPFFGAGSRGGDGGGMRIQGGDGDPALGGGQEAFARTCTLLFLFYPFHNESVVWLAGRLSSMSALCALTAIFFSLRSRAPYNFWLAVLFWLIGLMAYESIIMLPLMIIVLSWRRSEGFGRLLRMTTAWTLVIVLYLIARYLVSGTLFARYGEEGMMGGGGAGYLIRALKGFGRVVLPPVERPGLMMLFFGVAAVLAAGVHLLLWKKRAVMRGAKELYLRLGLVFCLSMVVPVAFGISTRTSEGDRLLYFPSCFVCMLAGALLFMLVESKRVRLALAALFMAGGLFFIQKNNVLFRIASDASRSILATVALSPARHVVLINVPDEWEGATIFRNNLDKALVIYATDTNKVFVNNYLMRLDYLQVPGEIGIVDRADGRFIFPNTLIRDEPGGKGFIVENVRTGVRRSFSKEEDVVFYWDKSRLKSVILK